jgi:hypothetical protein
VLAEQVRLVDDQRLGERRQLGAVGVVVAEVVVVIEQRRDSLSPRIGASSPR